VLDIGHIPKKVEIKYMRPIMTLRSKLKRLNAGRILYKKNTVITGASKIINVFQKADTNTMTSNLELRLIGVKVTSQLYLGGYTKVELA
jgi:hypothetical protein